MIGDENTQPNESVQSISQLAEMLDEGGEGGEEAGEALAELDSEDSGEAETVEDAEEEGEAEESEEPAKQKFTIKHDGKEVELELSPAETVDMLQRSFDYTQKTMQVAEERKAVEAQRAKVSELEQQHGQALNETLARLQSFATFMESQIGDPPSIELAHENAAYYLAQKEAYERQRASLDGAYRSIHAVQEQQARSRQATLLQQADETFEHLKNTLPGWKDAPDAKLQELADYMAPLGITPHTAAEAFVQKGIWELANKAKAYDALMAQKATLKPKSELPKVHKPGNPQPPQLARRQEAIKRHKANPSINSLADLL